MKMLTLGVFYDFDVTFRDVVGVNTEVEIKALAFDSWRTDTGKI